MGTARMHAHVETPIEATFDYLADFRHTPEWVTSIVKLTAEGPMTKVGEHFDGTMKLLGRTYTGEGRVTEFEWPDLIAFASTSSEGQRQTWTTRLTPEGTGTGIDMVLEYEVPMSLLGAIADKLFIERTVQRSLEQSRDNLVALVEHSVLQPV
jgi:uncharacterized protein YndB with AHSA1/START domain